MTNTPNHPLLLLLFMVVGACQVLCQGSEAIVLADSSVAYQRIHQYVEILEEDGGPYTVEELLEAPPGSFTPYADYLKTARLPPAVWARFTVQNSANRERQLILFLTSWTKRIVVFTVRDGSVVQQSKDTGYDVPSSEKEIPSVYGLVPITVPAQGSATYYVRQEYPPHGRLEECMTFAIKEGPVNIYQIAIRQAGQALYAGIMIMFSLVSFFTYLLFKDRSFLYFGAVHLAFSCYFLETFQSLLLDASFIGWFSLQYFTVSFLILSLTVFIAHYLRLRTRSHYLYGVYMTVAIVGSLITYPVYFFTQNIYLSGFVSNLFIIPWIIMGLTLIVNYAIKGEVAAKNLLIAVGFFALAGLVQIATMLRFIPANTVSSHIFQISTVLFSLFIFYRLFEMVRAIDLEKKEAISINTLKNKFFANISHEFRTPLTLIMGPLQQLNDRSTEEQDTQLIDTALKHSSRLLNMVNQLLDLSRIESDHLLLYVEEHDFMAFAKNVFLSFESLAEAKGIQMHFQGSAQTAPLWYDLEKMEIILFNLLSNAFKYTPAGGTVSLDITEEEEAVSISITDTGVGISKEDLPHVFDRFFRVTQSASPTTLGSGIGLSLSKELIDLHGGSVAVQSEKGKGTTFVVHFKKGNGHFDPSLLSDSHSQISSSVDIRLLEEETPGQAATGKAPKSSRPTILVVEDNNDVRNYIKSVLDGAFDVLEAENGQLGYEKAIESMPQLIISDVMMPVMDGFGLCKAIKSNVNTSHIPLILLTAKVEREDRISGLELGADDYLHKPFHAKELTIRVKKLIELRVQLREKLLQSPLTKITPLEGNPVENQFIEQVSRLVNQQLGNPSFGVDQLADEIGLSKSQLNRKIKSITELTTNKYIQYIRLQKARELLEKEDKNVSEVTYLVGFSSVAYFVKCFKGHFGETPGAYQKS